MNASDIEWAIRAHMARAGFDLDEHFARVHAEPVRRPAGTYGPRRYLVSVYPIAMGDDLAPMAEALRSYPGLVGDVTIPETTTKRRRLRPQVEAVVDPEVGVGD